MVKKRTKPRTVKKRSVKRKSSSSRSSKISKRKTGRTKDHPIWHSVMEKRLKILGVYEIAVSSVAFILFVYILIVKQFLAASMLVSILGIVGGVLLIERKKAGWCLSLIWAAMQVFLVQINLVLFDFSQLFRLYTFISFRTNTGYYEIALNFVGLALVILFATLKSEFDKKQKTR